MSLRSLFRPVRTYTTLSPTLSLSTLRERLRSIGGGTVHLDLSYRPGIALLRLDNPAAHNALTPHMMSLLSDKVDNLTAHIAEPSAQTLAVILTGSPHKSFCAGLDLGAAREHFLTAEAGESFSVLMQDTLYRLFMLPIVTIAAVNGAALGGGAELTTACDHRVISKAGHARIQFVQAKMGVSPGWGGGGRLVQLVGRTKALRLLGTAEPITAENGANWGLVDAVAEEGEDVVETAVEFARYFFGKVSAHMGEGLHGVHAVRGMKRVVARASEVGEPREVMEFEREVFRSLWGGEDNLRAIERSKRKK